MRISLLIIPKTNESVIGERKRFHYRLFNDKLVFITANNSNSDLY